MSKKATGLLIGLALLLLVLSACSTASSTKSNFPTGKFLLPNREFEGIYFNDDGTWYGFYYGEHVAEGKYKIKDDLYIEEANPDFACPTSATYKYSFDGTNLKFELVGEDTCQMRRESLDGVTYVLSK